MAARYLVFDTESTGLHIIVDKPFLFQYGLVDKHLDLLGIYIVDSTNKTSMATFIQHLKNVPVLVGHNIKFDINMCITFGIDPDIFKHKKYLDTAVLARLVVSHDIQKDKTFGVALKKLGYRYLGVDAADEERKLKHELSQLTIAHKQKMKDYFISVGIWDTSLKSREQTKILNEIYNKWNKIYHKYPQFKAHRKRFLAMHRAPNYSDVSNIKTYGATDIKITHGLLKLFYLKIPTMKQTPTVKRISDVVYPIVDMERAGLTIDVQRLLQDRAMIVKEMAATKIIDPRTGDTLSIGQHAKLKELYEYESGMYLKSADKETRAKVAAKSPAARAANYLAKMEKYLSTYITGILNKLVNVDGEWKVYTQYNLAGTITGRLSSDFQQFPRDPLVLNNGYEVNIRSWFITPKDYKYMFYFDYSQMELRLQCEWTNIVNGEPDKNMSRAFQPYQCYRVENGKSILFEQDYDPDWTKYDWYLNEHINEAWHPTDLHGLTAKEAFPNIDESHAEWKHYRSLGKRTNFAVNYGASAPAVANALHVDLPTARRLVAGYKKAFQGVVKFGKWLQNRVRVTTNIPNLMFRRYYSRNKHLMQNWLVQGSGADILLEKIYEVWVYIQDKPHWQLFLTVHDEIALYCKDIPEAQLKQEVKEIQETMTVKFSAVDITVDVEVTKTKWSEKKEWK